MRNPLVEAVRRFREGQKAAYCAKIGCIHIPLTDSGYSNNDRMNNELSMKKLKHNKVVSNVVIQNGRKYIDVLGDLLPGNRV